MLQIGALGIGAWLVLQQQVTAGAIVAGSILLGRALAPIDQLLGGWRQVVKHRQAWSSVRAAYRDPAAKPKDYTPLPRPAPNSVCGELKSAFLAQKAASS